MQGWGRRHDGGRVGGGGNSIGRRESSRREVVPRRYMPVVVRARTKGGRGSREEWAGRGL
eukprot:3429763-Rhodomonas_salina.1